MTPDSSAFAEPCAITAGAFCLTHRASTTDPRSEECVAMALHDEVDRLRAGIEALHRPVHPVFSWQSGLRFDEPCPECHGKAGVHSCGCWSDEDAEFVCFECSRPSSGHLRRDIPWPCETAALINPPTEGGTNGEV